MGVAADEELDVREVAKPDRHPLIFERFAALAPGEAFVLVNTHEPVHLREEFERDFPGAYGWESRQAAPRHWRVRISRRGAPLPHVLADLQDLGGDGAAGAVWRLEMTQRQLDANVVRLGPDEVIAAHAESRLDVLLLVVAGSGEMVSADVRHELRPGRLVWLPRGAHRELRAGAEGLSYLTVHTRRPGLSIAPAAPPAG